MYLINYNFYWNSFWPKKQLSGSFLNNLYLFKILRIIIFRTVVDQPLIIDIKSKEKTLSAFIVRVYLRENIFFKRFCHSFLTRETFVFTVSSILLYTGGIRQTIITSLLRAAVLSSSYYCTKNRFLTPTAAPWLNVTFMTIPRTRCKLD